MSGSPSNQTIRGSTNRLTRVLRGSGNATKGLDGLATALGRVGDNSVALGNSGADALMNFLDGVEGLQESFLGSTEVVAKYTLELEDQARTAQRNSILIGRSQAETEAYGTSLRQAATQYQQLTGRSYNESMEMVTGLLETFQMVDRDIGFSFDTEGLRQADEYIDLLKDGVAQAEAQAKAGIDDTTASTLDLVTAMGAVEKAAGLDRQALNKWASEMMITGDMTRDQVTDVMGTVMAGVQDLGIKGVEAFEAIKASEDIMLGMDASDRDEFAAQIIESAGVMKKAGYDFEKNVNRMYQDEGEARIEQAAVMSALSGDDFNSVLESMQGADMGDLESQRRLARTTEMGLSKMMDMSGTSFEEAQKYTSPSQREQLTQDQRNDAALGMNIYAMVGQEVGVGGDPFADMRTIQQSRQLDSKIERAGELGPNRTVTDMASQIDTLSTTDEKIEMNRGSVNAFAEDMNAFNDIMRDSRAAVTVANQVYGDGVTVLEQFGQAGASLMKVLTLGHSSEGMEEFARKAGMTAAAATAGGMALNEATGRPVDTKALFEGGIDKVGGMMSGAMDWMKDLVGGDEGESAAVEDSPTPSPMVGSVTPMLMDMKDAYGSGLDEGISDLGMGGFDIASITESLSEILEGDGGGIERSELDTLIRGQDMISKSDIGGLMEGIGSPDDLEGFLQDIGKLSDGSGDFGLDFESLIGSLGGAGGLEATLLPQEIPTSEARIDNIIKTPRASDLTGTIAQANQEVGQKRLHGRDQAPPEAPNSGKPGGMDIYYLEEIAETLKDLSRALASSGAGSRMSTDRQLG